MPAEAATDVQHPMPGAQIELGRNVALLGLLGLFEGELLVAEIGAGILQIIVQE